MPDAVIHPTPQELAAFGLGKLSERDAAAVAAHLEFCLACTSAVATVTPDSFLGKVRASASDGSSFPPGLAKQDQLPNSTDTPTPPLVVGPDLPTELQRHRKYLLLRELGRGGMGVVYQARHKEMEREVVIKVMNRTLLDRPDSVERFRREIRAAAQLSHPNIVAAYDSEQVGELHMLVMEFVPGQSLADVLKNEGPLTVSHACHYMRQAALGLQHASERGMVHRDIKPGNLMLTPNGEVKILDFGIAKVVSERVKAEVLTSSGHYMGTPAYSSPEQAEDARTADIRADLYSLGCTLYCLLAGRPPFREDTIVKTILAHRDKTPQPLPELRPDVPESLWRVVERLMAKEPSQRYQKPIEVVQALAPFGKSGTRPDAEGDSPILRGKGTPNSTQSHLVPAAPKPEPVTVSYNVNQKMLAGDKRTAPPAGSWARALTLTNVLLIMLLLVVLLIVVPAVFRDGKTVDQEAVARMQLELEKLKRDFELKKMELERQSKAEAETRRRMDEMFRKNWTEEEKRREQDRQRLQAINDKDERAALKRTLEQEQQQREKKRLETEKKMKEIMEKQRRKVEGLERDLVESRKKQQTIVQQPPPVIQYSPYHPRYYWPW